MATLNGTSGDDRLVGTDNTDDIRGMPGNDTLSGGPGNDTYRFAGDFGDDVITDFGKGNNAGGQDNGGDRLDLTAFTSYELVQVGDDTVVTVDGGTITVRNATPEEVASRTDVARLLRGTLIRTPSGDVPVETLKIGDEIMTVDGMAKRLK